MVETVKIHSTPCKTLWSLFNFAAAPCFSSQAIILAQFRLTSSLETLRSHGQNYVSGLGSCVRTE